ncbi:hypothetical protein BC940DRAFT_337074 [Gongronella butleri]|nr:hypothetical protein BC940DRAFT_337074 [Gongronella butleri]
MEPDGREDTFWVQPEAAGKASGGGVVGDDAAATVLLRTATLTASYETYRWTRASEANGNGGGGGGPSSSSSSSVEGSPPCPNSAMADPFFETRTNWLMEQMALLHRHLGQMVPTRSHYHVPPSQSSTQSDQSSCSSSLVSLPANTTDWELRSTDTAASGPQAATVVPLHPLHAAHEDMHQFETTWAALQTRMHQVSDAMAEVQRQYPSPRLALPLPTTENDDENAKNGDNHENSDDHQKNMVVYDGNHNDKDARPLLVQQQHQVARLTQLQQTFGALQHRMTAAERQFKAFHQGFQFGQVLLAIRTDLDAVQANMTQQRSPAQDEHKHIVLQWEKKMETTTHSLDQLRREYPHFFEPRKNEDLRALLPVDHDENMDDAHDNEHDEAQKDALVPTDRVVLEDELYLQRWQQLVDKNSLVRSWVDEVRVWFAEAERIRRWIDERRHQLEALALPEPLTNGSDNDDENGAWTVTPAQLQQWQQDHRVLEHDMETFNGQDMARLRAHVKALTGGKDLSPADTTTIEITLTTLTTLDKVMHTLRDKTHRLDLLTKRDLWENQYASVLAWLHATEHDVDAFLAAARWHQQEPQIEPMQDNHQENDKAYWIDRLLTLEHALSDFDKADFSTLIARFEDMYDTAQEELPSHLEQRQSTCEEFFEDLFKRMAFVRTVVEQRLAIMDFLDMVAAAEKDAHALQTDLANVCTFAPAPDHEWHDMHDFNNDDDDDDQDAWADKVQAIQEHIVALAATQRIPYPLATLSIDENDNNDANQHVRQWIGHHRTQLVHLGESVDKDWQLVKQRWQYRQRMQDMIRDADECKQWALEQQQQVITVEQQQQLVFAASNSSNSVATCEQLDAWERWSRALMTQLVAKQAAGGTMQAHVDALAEVIQSCLPTPVEEATTRMTRATEAMHDAYADLKQQLLAHDDNIMQFRQQLEKGRNLHDLGSDLAQWTQTMRASLPGIKHAYGFITGESLDQDEDRLHQLQAAVQQCKAQKQARDDMYTQYVQQQSDSQQQDTALVDNWASLTRELDDLDAFQQDVAQWYNRQRRLSHVQQALDQIYDDEANGRDTDDAHWIDIGRAQLEILDSIFQSMPKESPKPANGLLKRVARSPASKPKDPLQTANQACCKERYLSLREQAQEVVAQASARLERRQQQEHAWREYQDQVSALVAAIEQDQQRLVSDLAAQRALAMRLAANANAEGLLALVQEASDQQALSAHRVDRWGQWEQLRKKLTPPATPSSSLPRGMMDGVATTEALHTTVDAVLLPPGVLDDQQEQQYEEDHRRMRAALQELDHAMAVGKQQMQQIRQLYVHAKATIDIRHWLKQCDASLTHLMADVGIQDDHHIRTQIGASQAKLDAMHASLDDFQRIHARAIALIDDNNAIPRENDLVDASNARQTMISNADDLQAKVLAMHQRLDHIRNALDTHCHQATTAQRIKDLLRVIGAFRDRIDAVRVRIHDDDNDDNAPENDENDENEEHEEDALSAWLLTCPLPLLPTDNALDDAQHALDQIENDIDTQLVPLRHEVEQEIATQEALAPQEASVAHAMSQLAQAIDTKRQWLARARHLAHVMTVLDEWDVLLSALSDVVDQTKQKMTSMTLTSQQASPCLRRADLQAALIELDTRHSYYEPNIMALMKEAGPYMDNDSTATDTMYDGRLNAFYEQLIKRWYYLQHEVQVQRKALLSKMPLLSSSMTTRRQLQMQQQGIAERRRTLQPAMMSAAVQQQQQQQQEQTKSDIMTTTRPRRATYVPPPSMNAPSPTNQLKRPQSSMSAAQKSLTPLSYRRSYTPTTQGTSPRLITAERALKRSSWRSSLVFDEKDDKNKKRYVADPKNDLDVAVGNIVNDSPYGINVKMVPGEVGRYWFGDTNPKLAYCRILRSRMVMVRVGGGWTELSQFLRDHALIDDHPPPPPRSSSLSNAPNSPQTTSDSSSFASSRASPSPSPSPHRRIIPLGNHQSHSPDHFHHLLSQSPIDNKNKRHSHPPLTIAPPATSHRVDGSLQASNSTETFTSPSYYRLAGAPLPPPPPSNQPIYHQTYPAPPSPGIKEGNKFLVTDHDGKQVQVTMTKARSKQTSSSPRHKTPWR